MKHYRRSIGRTTAESSCSAAMGGKPLICGGPSPPGISIRAHGEAVMECCAICTGAGRRSGIVTHDEPLCEARDRSIHLFDGRVFGLFFFEETSATGGHPLRACIFYGRTSLRAADDCGAIRRSRHLVVATMGSGSRAKQQSSAWRNALLCAAGIQRRWGRGGTGVVGIGVAIIAVDCLRELTPISDRARAAAGRKELAVRAEWGGDEARLPGGGGLLLTERSVLALMEAGWATCCRGGTTSLWRGRRNRSTDSTRA